MKTRLFKNFLFLLCFIFSTLCWSQYNGIGEFEEITDLAELTDGYYVIVDEDNNFAMNNFNSGSYFENTAVTPNSGSIINPDEAIVWKIETDGSGRTIYNEEIGVYVSYSGSGNSSSESSSVGSDAERWSFTYSNTVFSVENLGTAGRVLRYNTGSPRFACYSSSFGNNLLLYKLETNSNDPELFGVPATVSGLNYIENEGPSTPDSFEVTGQNLDNSNVTLTLPANSDFEISTQQSSGYSNSITLNNYDGSSTTIYTRLIAGLAIGDYNATVTVSGGSASNISINLEGTVIEEFNLPYTNGLRDQTDWDEATGFGFEFNNTTFEAAAGGYIRFSPGGNIITPTIDFTNYTNLEVSFDLEDFGGSSGQEITISISDNGGVSYIDLNTFSVPGSYTTFTETIDLSSYNTSTGKIKFEMTGGGASTRFRDLSITIPNITYTYNGSWSPANPVGNAATTDDIDVISGSVEIDQNIEVNDVTISAGATLEISANLIANGDITNNGDLIFKSTSIQNTGTLGPINATSSITNVTVERFIPAKRAFRFISSSVTTSSSINENWQENQHNTGTNFPSDNKNMNDGFGTHITGSTTGANGFDATPSGNPSLFMFDNSTQTWNAVSNTDSNSLTAGEPYRLMVRGSRAVNVTDNSASDTDTRLRTTGNLVTGTQIFSNLTDDVNEFNFVGNPYQSVVNMNSVLSSSTNIDANEYYIWDPNKGTRGGYVTVALPAGTNSDGSAANEYLQPNQAFFVAPTGGANPEIVFEENHKVVDNLTSVFNEDEDLTLSVQLVALTNAEELLTDSFMVLFSENYSNSYNEKDASKIGNLDENIALVNGSKILSIERRNIPTANDSLAFYNNNYRFSNYNLKVEVPYFENQQAVLYDDYLKTETTLAEGLNIINFNVDLSIEESVKTNRFSIYFRNKNLSTPDFNRSKISLYPNPFKEGNLTIQTSLTNGENVEVGIYNMLGEQVFLKEEKVSGQHQKIQLQNLKLESGVYIVRINSAEKLSSKKLIIE